MFAPFKGTLVLEYSVPSRLKIHLLYIPRRRASHLHFCDPVTHLPNGATLSKFSMITYYYFSLSPYHILLLVLSIVAIVVVASRFWARKIQKSSFELTDYLVVLGLVDKLSRLGLQPSNGI